METESISDPRSTINFMPFPAILKIASYLSPRDLLSFSHTCKNVFDTCDRDTTLWTRSLQREKLEYHQEFLDVAASIVDKQIMFKTGNPSKLSFLMWSGTKRKWRTSLPLKIVKQKEREFEDSGPLSFHMAQHLNFHVFDKSKFFVVSQKTFSCDNDKQWRLYFNLMDVRTGVDKTHSRIVNSILRLNDDAYSMTVNAYLRLNICVYVLDDFILQVTKSNHFSSPGYIYSCYKIEMGKFVRAWGPKPFFKDHRMIDISVYEKFFAVTVAARTNPDMGRCVRFHQQKECKCREYMVFLFNIEDGSLLLEYRPCGNSTFRHSFEEHWSAGSNDGWFVQLIPPCLHAVNYKTKTTKVLKEEIIDIRTMTIHGNRLACFYIDDFVRMIDLPSGRQIRSIHLNISPKFETPKRLFMSYDPYYIPPLRFESKFTMTFDSKSNLIVLFRNELKSPTVWIALRLENDERQVEEDLHYDHEWQMDDCRYIFGNLVGPASDQQFVIAWKTPEGVHHFTDTHWFDPKSSIVKANPFLVEVGNDFETVTFDFLNINQYIH